MPMIRITPSLSIAEDELALSFVRASGPGGQNVNKLATAVELRFDAGRSPTLDSLTLARLKRLAGRRMTEDGVLIIKSRSFRTQERNRAEALARLIDLLKRASERPARRLPTRPTLASLERRRRMKDRRSALKKLRRRIED
jgi:ribosome-associated protein